LIAHLDYSLSRATMVLPGTISRRPEVESDAIKLALT